MKNNFNEDFKDFVDARLEHIGETVLKNKNYKVLNKKASDTFNKLMDILKDHEEAKKLLEQYEDENTESISIEVEITYKAGLKDGGNISNMLGA